MSIRIPSPAIPDPIANPTFVTARRNARAATRSSTGSTCASSPCFTALAARSTVTTRHTATRNAPNDRTKT